MYIDANPIRAGIANPHEYIWSSYAHHTGARNTVVSDLLTMDHWYQSLGRDVASRARAYEQQFERYLTLDEQPRPRRPDGKSAG
jgi:hypothetical protein